MSSKKLLKAASGAAAGGAGLNVEDVFINWLYAGNNSTSGQTIQNGVDYTDGEALVWLKARSDAKQSVFVDTVRGANKNISPANTTFEDTEDTLSAFLSNGFTVKHTTSGDYAYTVNRSGEDYVSWTFKTAPKFFDIQTWTGDGTSNRAISHNLESTPGCIIVKSTSNTLNWYVYHRDLFTTSYPDAEDNFVMLNLTNAANDTTLWGGTAPTSTDFTVSGANNNNGNTYVAYIFAHNDGDGNFGPDGDQDIIKCGSYVGDATDYQEVDVGFEAQWVMTKRISGTSNWDVSDSMRGLTTDYHKRLSPNAFSTEYTETFKKIYNNGFMVAGNNADSNASTHTYIYIAIRRGPMATTDDAANVFDVAAYTSDGTNGRVVSSSPSAVDLVINMQRDGSNSSVFYDRVRGHDKELSGRLTAIEQTASNEGVSLDTNAGIVVNNAGYYDYPNYGSEKQVLLGWKRAPKFFDIVSYRGTGAARTVNHNLEVVPEMMWVKRRDGTTGDWIVYHSGIDVNSDGAPETDYILLNSNAGAGDSAGFWNDTAPTASNFSLGSSNSVNATNSGFIAYLFATVAGVSKVGSFTGNGGTLNVDCGFSSGAKFAIIKRDSGPWRVFDTDRGIVSGNDPFVNINLTDAEVTSTDLLDPYSSGFTVNVNSDYGWNTNGSTYYFYAVA